MRNCEDNGALQNIGKAMRDWYERSLVNRISLKAQLLLGGVLMTVFAASYLMVSEQVKESVEVRLEAIAMLNGQRLQSELDQLIAETQRLSARSLVITALSDSSEGQGYLRPFLQEFKEAFPELRDLTLFDLQGQIVAGAGGKARPREADEIRRLSQPQFVLRLDGGRAELETMFPVEFVATRQIEGGLAATIDLRALANRIIQRESMQNGLPVSVSVFANGKALLEPMAARFGEQLTLSRPVGGTLAEHGQGLSLEVSAPKDFAYYPLQRLFISLLAVTLVVVALVMVLTRKISETIIAPLAEMSHRAMEIASAGADGLRELKVTRSDEIGWMGTAFNEMVFSLRSLYSSQEDEVRRRTEELAQARERLSQVLAGIDDVVYSIDPEFRRFEYISPASRRLFGLAPEACCEHPELLEAMIVPEDLPRLREARRKVQAAESVEIRYRVVTAEGGLRWVLDRFHLVCNPTGEALWVSGLLRDVTAAVEAEDSLLLRDRALASSSCGVVITDMRLSGQPILYVNDAFERITGYSADQVLGRNCGFLQGEKHEQQHAIQEIRDAIAKGRECKVVIRNYRKDGAPFWNELQLSPLYDDSGRVTHYIGIQNDISASIAATQALVDSEQRMSLIIDALHEGVWDWNIKDDSLFTSPSWASILGLQPFDVAAEPFFSTFARQLPEDWSQRVLDEIRAHMEGNSNGFYLEHQMLHADGRRIWVANHGRIVDRAADGSPLRMVGTIVDITQRMEASQRIIGLMRQLDAIFTLSPDGFVYFKQDGLLSFVNPAFERMTGLQSGEVSGMTLPEFCAGLEARAEPGQPFTVCDEGDDMEGQLLYLTEPTRRVLLVSRRGGGDGSSAVVYLRDVTRETEVDRMKSEFLSTAAHELRTPMASIMGFAELLLLRDFGPDRTKDMLQTIHRQARRLTDLINELLDLARIEARAGKDFKLVRQSLLPVINDAVAALHIEGDRSRMQVQLPDSLPEVDIDPAKMQQAIINLLSNAYKYSPDGGPIEIGIRHREHNGRSEVGIHIRDHGIGMTPEQVERVFERFFRADPSGNIPGTGLGMSLVKEIADRHNGDIDVQSTLGAGTGVTLWLPMAGSEALAANNELDAGQGALTLWLDEIGAEAGQPIH